MARNTKIFQDVFSQAVYSIDENLFKTSGIDKTNTGRKDLISACRDVVLDASLVKRLAKAIVEDNYEEQRQSTNALVHRIAEVFDSRIGYSVPFTQIDENILNQSVLIANQIRENIVSIIFSRPHILGEDAVKIEKLGLETTQQKIKEAGAIGVNW